MDALINVVLPVFGIILTGYLAGRFEALGPESAAALNRFVFYFALPCALFIFTARAPSDKIFNWPFIGAIVSGALLTLLVALIVGRLWFHHHDVATLSMVGLTAGWGITDTWDCRSFLRPMDRMERCRQSLPPSVPSYCLLAVPLPFWRAHALQGHRHFVWPRTWLVCYCATRW